MEVLKILYLEDLPDDAILVERALKKAGIAPDIRVVENKKDFLEGLREFSPDIILSDHSLSAFDSHEALKLVQREGLSVPFILVTATVSEEYAVSIIKDGASDYILKDRLQRLPNAILAAREKFLLEKKQLSAIEALRESELKYKLLFESNPLPMWMISKNTPDIIAVNEAAVRHYGYTRTEFLQMNSQDLIPAEDRENTVTHLGTGAEDFASSGIWRHRKKNGDVIMVDIIAHDIMYGSLPARLLLANDVTERLATERELARQREIQQKIITKTSMQVQEQVREEIGTELHDNINQILAAVKMHLDFAISKDQSKLPFLVTSRENIMLAINEIRKLSHTLIAPSLGDTTLEMAIQHLLQGIRAVTPFTIELISENKAEDKLDKEAELMLYRITQEQINNISKHADAKNVTIHLQQMQTQVVLSIKDDGKGFDTAQKAEGIGLRNIKHRAELYDGTAEIISSPGHGCVLKIVIPIGTKINASSDL